jgi:hypothetical protein
MKPQLVIRVKKHFPVLEKLFYPPRFEYPYPSAIPRTKWEPHDLKDLHAPNPGNWEPIKPAKEDF